MSHMSPFPTPALSSLAIFFLLVHNIDTSLAQTLGYIFKYYKGKVVANISVVSSAAPFLTHRTLTFFPQESRILMY